MRRDGRGKGGVLDKQIKMVISLKIVVKLFLSYLFQQGYRDVLINKSVLESHIKLVHTHVRGSLRVQFPLYSYWFRPWLLS